MVTRFTGLLRCVRAGTYLSLLRLLVRGVQP
jgi:hypothetical protein